MTEQSTSYITGNGNKIWYLPSKGKSYFHRLDGPAIEWHDGTKQWFVNGERHRLDGPASEDENGSKCWWVDGNLIPTEEVEEWLEENDVNLSTDVGQREKITGID